MTDTAQPSARELSDGIERAQEERARPRLDFARWRDLSLVPVILVLGLIGFIVSPAFLTTDNLVGVVQQSTELGLLVLGLAMVLICGRMDLSLESTLAVAPSVAMWLVLPSEGEGFHGIGLFPTWLAIPLCLAVGAVIGGTNGFLMLKLRVNGFIATLGMLTMLRGLHVGLTDGKSIVNVPDSFSYLGNASWLGVPGAVWLCLALYALTGLVLAYMRHGRALYAIGGNPEAARAAGVRTDRITWIVLALVSTLAAFGRHALHRALRLDLGQSRRRLDLPGVRGCCHRRYRAARRTWHRLRGADGRADPPARRQRHDARRGPGHVEPVPQRDDHHRRADHLALRQR